MQLRLEIKLHYEANDTNWWVKTGQRALSLSQKQHQNIWNIHYTWDCQIPSLSTSPRFKSVDKRADTFQSLHHTGGYCHGNVGVFSISLLEKSADEMPVKKLQWCFHAPSYRQGNSDMTYVLLLIQLFSVSSVSSILNFFFFIVANTPPPPSSQQSCVVGRLWALR